MRERWFREDDWFDVDGDEVPEGDDYWDYDSRGLWRAKERDRKRGAKIRDRRVRTTRKHSHRWWAKWGHKLEQVRLYNPGQLDQDGYRHVTATAVQTAWHQLVETGRAQRYTQVLERLGRMGALPPELIRALPAELVREKRVRWSFLPQETQEGLVGTWPRLADPVCAGLPDTLLAGLTVVQPTHPVTYAHVLRRYASRWGYGSGPSWVGSPLWLADGFDDDNCWQGSVGFWPRDHVSSYEYRRITRDKEVGLLLGGNAELVLLRPVWAEGLRLPGE